MELKAADPEELQRETQALKNIFEHECRQDNDPASCHRLAEFYQSVEKNFLTAVSLYKYVGE